MAKGRAVGIALESTSTALTRKHGAPQPVAERARIALAAARGLNNKEIASKLGVCTHTVGTWRNRFADLSERATPAQSAQHGDFKSFSRHNSASANRQAGLLLAL